MIKCCKMNIFYFINQKNINGISKCLENGNLFEYDIFKHVFCKVQKCELFEFELIHLKNGENIK